MVEIVTVFAFGKQVAVLFEGLQDRVVIGMVIQIEIA